MLLTFVGDEIGSGCCVFCKASLAIFKVRFSLDKFSTSVKLLSKAASTSSNSCAKTSAASDISGCNKIVLIKYCSPQKKPKTFLLCHDRCKSWEIWHFLGRYIKILSRNLKFQKEISSNFYGSAIRWTQAFFCCSTRSIRALKSSHLHYIGKWENI